MRAKISDRVPVRDVPVGALFRRNAVVWRVVAVARAWGLDWRVVEVVDDDVRFHRRDRILGNVLVARVELH